MQGNFHLAAGKTVEKNCSVFSNILIFISSSLENLYHGVPAGSDNAGLSQKYMAQGVMDLIHLVTTVPDFVSGGMILSWSFLCSIIQFFCIII